MTKRIRMYDTIKFLAIFLVFMTHFERAFGTMFCIVLKPGHILYGITGKFAVAMFGVLVGFFAVNSHKKYSLFQYIVTRYVQFALGGLIINMLVAVRLRILGETVSLKEAVFTSMTLGTKFFPEYWCMLPFFIAGIICWFNGKYKAGIKEILIEIILLVLIDQTWVAICLLGNVYERLINCEKFMNEIIPLYKILALVVVTFIIKGSESKTMYLIDGLSCVLVLLVLVPRANGRMQLKAIFENKVLSSFGKNGFGFYIIHKFCYVIVGKYIITQPLTNSRDLNQLIAFAVSLAVIILLSYPITAIINLCTKVAFRIACFGENKTKELVPKLKSKCKLFRSC